MIKFYFPASCKILPLAACLLWGCFAMEAGAHTILPGDSLRIRSFKNSGKLTDTRKNKPAFLNTAVKVNFIPFKPADLKAATASPAKSVQQPADNSLLSNVSVYPNPVEDQINFSYHISKSSTVTIKIMDLLGNEITTLMSQKMPAGDQLNSYSIATKLNSGYYFIRIIAGNESKIKRISVL